MAEEKKPRITISVSELRADLPTILHKVALLDQEYLIEKHGQPYAILKPVPKPLLDKVAFCFPHY